MQSNNLFDKDYLLELEDRYLHSQKVPTAHLTALSPRFKNERDRIEGIYKLYLSHISNLNIDKSEQSKIIEDITSRLRAKENSNFHGALHELQVFKILKNLVDEKKEAIIPQPKLENMTPDFLIEREGSNDIVVEAWRAGDDKRIRIANRQHEQIMSTVKQIEHKVLGVSILPRKLPDHRLTKEDLDDIKEFIAKKIDKRGNSLPNSGSKAVFSKGKNVRIEFKWVHLESSGRERPMRTPIITGPFGYFGSIPDSIEEGINNKLKYSTIIKKRGMGYVLAIGSAAVFLDRDKFIKQLRSGKLLNPWVSGCILIRAQVDQTKTREYSTEYIRNADARNPLAKEVESQFTKGN